MQLDDSSIILFKLITGELIIGVLDQDLTNENKSSDVLNVKYPAVIGISDNSFYLAKYNQFSKLDMIILMGNNIVYVDVPNDKVISYYKELWEPTSKMDDEGMGVGTGHSIH